MSNWSKKHNPAGAPVRKSVVPDANDENKKIISSHDLVVLEEYGKEKRVEACNGVDPMHFTTLYAQEKYIYNPDNSIIEVDALTYKNTPTNDRLNKYGKIYTDNTPIITHKLFADIMNEVAVKFYKETKGDYSLWIYDSLRTFDSAKLMFDTAAPENKELLAAPGKSAHNRGMAIDLAIVDRFGRDIERVDNPHQAEIKRDYDGPAISDKQKELRVILERTFQQVAYNNHGVVIAPLPREQWDYRFTESLEPEFLKRMLTSLARCTDQTEKLRASELFQKTDINYKDFKEIWNNVLNTGGELNKMFGVENAPPPKKSKMQEYCYDNYKPVYDRHIREKFGEITVKNSSVIGKAD